MKNLRILALLLASVAVSNVASAKNDNGNYSKKGKKETKSERIARQEEQWVEGNRSQPVEPSEVRYESNTSGSSRGSCCKRKNCNTCSVAPCAKPPVCRKMVPVETCADKHQHVSYSYTCPVGYTEITQ